MSRKQLALFEPVLLVQALTDAVKKLSPRAQWRNPVMFVVWAGSVLTTLLTLAMVTGQIAGSALFTGGYQSVAMVHRTVRQFCRSAGGRPQQSPGKQSEGSEKDRVRSPPARPAP